VTVRRNILYLGAGRVGGAIRLPVQPPELNARAGCAEYLDEPFLYRKPFHATLGNSECQGRVGRTCLLNSVWCRTLFKNPGRGALWFVRLDALGHCGGSVLANFLVQFLTQVDWKSAALHIWQRP